MLQSFYEKIGAFILRRRAEKEARKENSFNNFVENSLKFLVILPFDDVVFSEAEPILHYLRDRNKSVSLLLHEHKINMVQNKSSFKFVSFTNEDINRIYLPGKGLAEKLVKGKFDVVIDLNLKVNLFSFAVSYLAKSKFKIGFTKKNSDYYYNFQIPPDQTKIDNSYGNLVNCLKMF